MLASLQQAALRKQMPVFVHVIALDMDTRVLAAFQEQGATLIGAADEAQLNAQFDFILENKILIRIDPADFAPGGVPTTTTSTVPEGGSSTSLVEGGAAEEPVTEPGGSGPDTSTVDSGAADESGTG